MNTITRQSVVALQKDIAEALKPVAAKYGLTLKPSKGRYDSYSVKVATEFVVAGAEQEQAGLIHNSYLSQRFDLKVGDKVVTLRGENFVVTGATARSEKYPLTGTMNGKGYRFSAKGLKREDGTTVVDKWAMPVGGDTKPVPAFNKGA